MRLRGLVRNVLGFISGIALGQSGRQRFGALRLAFRKQCNCFCTASWMPSPRQSAARWLSSITQDSQNRPTATSPRRLRGFRPQRTKGLKFERRARTGGLRRWPLPTGLASAFARLRPSCDSRAMRRPPIPSPRSATPATAPPAFAPAPIISGPRSRTVRRKGRPASFASWLITGRKVVCRWLGRIMSRPPSTAQARRERRSLSYRRSLVPRLPSLLRRALLLLRP